MSLEQEMQSLTKAVNTLTILLTEKADKIDKAVATEAPKAEAPAVEKPVVEKPVKKTAKPKATKAEQMRELEVVEKAQIVLEKCGGDQLRNLLSGFGANKVSDLKPGQGVAADFIARAEKMIAEEEKRTDDALMDDTPAPQEKAEVKVEAATMEDVKTALKKVIDHPELGRNFVSGILNELGVSRLGELAENKFDEAISKAADELGKVSA